MHDVSCSYLVVARQGDLELDRSAMIDDRSGTFAGLAEAIAATREMLVGFDAADLRDWCRVELLIATRWWDGSAWARLPETVFWSSRDVRACSLAIERLRALVPGLPEDTDAISSLDRGRIACMGLTRPVLAIAS